MATRYYQLLVINEPKWSEVPLLPCSSRLLGPNPASGATGIGRGRGASAGLWARPG